MKATFGLAAVIGVIAVTLAGCGGRQQPPAPMAPPIGQSAPMSPPINGGIPANGAQQGGVYNWQDVPVNQQVGIARAQFDQGGYQLVTDNGDTIVVPFGNQNLYVMRFGRSGAQTYFVNDNGAPTLYLAPGVGLANAAAQGALWYPIPNDFNYERPVYVGLAPSWNDYVNMGWYPGMTVYGGMWGYNPYRPSWMPGFVINIGGSRYNSWAGYSGYYTSHPGYYRSTVVYNNYNTAPRGPNTYRSTGFARSTRPFNSGASSSGSFGRGSFGSGSFGSGMRSSGSFGSGTRFTPSSQQGGGSFSRPSGSSSFGSGYSRPSGSFGGGGRSSGGSFGSRRR